MSWWRQFVARLVAGGRVNSLCIEHEDPGVPVEQGVPEAVSVLAAAAAGGD